MLAAALGFPAGVALLAQGDPARGEEKAADCAACHGPGGNSEVAEWPKLAGLDEAYIAAQLRAYQTGARYDQTMSIWAEGLSEQDMQDLGAYFATQRMVWTGALRSPDEAELKLGARVYRAGAPERHVAACVLCHGAAGEGQPAAGFTRLGGQHAEYMTLQLRAFQDGSRTDPLGMMGEIARGMTDEEMRAVASYAARLAGVAAE